MRERYLPGGVPRVLMALLRAGLFDQTLARRRASYRQPSQFTPAKTIITMRIALAASCLFAILSAAPLSAHPGTGIVTDRQGNVFYTDLVHVWRISPDGRKSIVVRDVHTHELAIDANGRLYGEDSQYLGGDRYRHRVWRRDPDGRMHDVVPWTDGFWRQYGFVTDARGAMYWTYCPDKTCTIQTRVGAGAVAAVKQKKPFDDRVNWIAAAPGGGLYVIDGGALKLLSPGGDLRTIAGSLGGEHAMGMLPEGNTVLVAVYGRRAVVRVAHTGKLDVVATTPRPWGPSVSRKRPMATS